MKNGLDSLQNNLDTNDIIKNFQLANFYNPKQSYINYLLTSLFIELKEYDLAKYYLQNAAKFESNEGDFYQFLHKNLY